jgi:hypothetical protein
MQNDGIGNDMNDLATELITPLEPLTLDHLSI